MARSLGSKLIHSVAGLAVLALCAASASACLLEGEGDAPFVETDAGACEPADCGPALGMPSVSCADGSWGGPTGRCAASAGGGCAWEVRSCPLAQPCGPGVAAACPETHYCAHGLGECLKPGADGVCRAREADCADDGQVVCGCDGRTWASACEAARKGTSVAALGPCEERRCRGIAGLLCPASLFCELPIGFCRVADAMGTCAAPGGDCPLIYQPVCGCDGATWVSPCRARAAGVSVYYYGACREEPCGGPLMRACAAGRYCRFDEGSCGASLGSCEAIPELCALALGTVCGCDGATYGSRCAAAQAGVSIAYAGACE